MYSMSIYVVTEGIIAVRVGKAFVPSFGFTNLSLDITVSVTKFQISVVSRWILIFKAFFILTITKSYIY